jgi:heat shock protein HslJ
MKKTQFYLMMLVIALCVAACGSQQSRTNQKLSGCSNSRDALDWSGTYFGTVPCADGPGILMELSLNADLTYSMTRVYQNRPGTFVNSGNFEWNDKGSEIKLKTGISDNGFQQFKVQEGTLVLLTSSGEVIEGDLADAYLLGKVETNLATSGLTNRYWRLVELHGNPVNYSEFSVEAFILMGLDGSISGNLGCNSFFGTFTVEEGNRIGFSQLGSTQKMCIDMNIETEMVNVLQMTDNYNLNENKLVLNRARMAPLARFEAVYMNQN